MAMLVSSRNRIKGAFDDRQQWLQETAYEVDHTADEDVVVDLATVGTIRSADLNELIRLHSLIRQKNGRLVLINAQDQVLQVFKVTRLDRLFELRISEPIDRSCS